MQLIDHWVVGFSGKRQLKNPEGVRRALREVLQGLRGMVQGELVALSSAAIGGDLLFATEAMLSGMQWICVLPFPKEAFFNENDFPEPGEREAAKQQMIEAADYEIVRIPDSVNELNDSDWRRAAFAEAGFKCVDEADIIVIVVHDGTEPGKPGGTGDVVAYARAAGRPIVIIDPDTLEVRRENWPTRLYDPLTERLRRLASGVLTVADRQALPAPTPAAIRVAEWRSGFAKAARQHVPGIRWGTSAVVVLHALATIITASVFLLLQPKILTFDASLPNRRELLMRTLEVSAFVFVLAGFIFLIWLLWKRPQVNAANYRFAAEVGRSMLATWCIPEAGSQIIRNLPREFAHFGRNLLLSQRLDKDRRVPDQISLPELERLANDYVTKRIQPQVKYYRDKYKKAERLASWFEISSVVLSFIAVLSAGVLAFSGGAESLHAVWAFAKLAAATAAPVAVSILVIHEVKRREARYKEMEGALNEYEKRITRARSNSALRDLVTDVERMLLGECHEWWVLAKANVAA